MPKAMHFEFGNRCLYVQMKHIYLFFFYYFHFIFNCCYFYSFDFPVICFVNHLLCCFLLFS